MTPDPPLFVLWYDFTKWLLTKTEKFPRKIRFTLTSRIDNLALDIIEGIVEARYTTKKKEILRRVDLLMERLRILLRMCHDKQVLDHKGYEYAVRKIDEAGRMVGGWRKEQERSAP